MITPDPVPICARCCDLPNIKSSKLVYPLLSVVFFTCTTAGKVFSAAMMKFMFSVHEFTGFTPTEIGEVIALSPTSFLVLFSSKKILYEVSVTAPLKVEINNNVAIFFIVLF